MLLLVVSAQKLHGSVWMQEPPVTLLTVVYLNSIQMAKTITFYYQSKIWICILIDCCNSVMYVHVSTCIKCLMYDQSTNHISFNKIVIQCARCVTVNMHQVFIHQVSVSSLFPTCLSPAPCRSYIDPPYVPVASSTHLWLYNRRRSRSGCMVWFWQDYFFWQFNY